MATHARIGNTFITQLKHLGNSFKLFGAVTVVLLVVLVTLAALRSGDQTVIAVQPPVQQAEVKTTTPEPVPASEPTSQEPVQAATPAAEIGWRVVDGARYYYLSDGNKATGAVNIQGVNFSFDEEGRWVSSRLDVPYISQLPDMPSGCEVVSVTMMLNYTGVAVTKEQLADKLPYADDPNVGFTGSLYVEGGYDSGGIIWPAGLLNLVRSYKNSVVDMTGRPWEDIQSSIDNNKPVCIWFQSEGLDHTVLLVGYSDTEVWLNDPLAEKDLAMDIGLFMMYWAGNGYRALSY